ncbi:MAG: hypothetical protein OEX02_21195 [Cyclobacteriaceae bacterium]|nr:hypothetical protein [Cyclobacteriaceae bacterium]
MKKLFSIAGTILLLYPAVSIGQDTTDSLKRSFLFKGQLSSWAHINPKNPYPLYLGGRYIPQANYEVGLPKSRMVDFEASANLYGNTGIHFFDSATAEGNINPYRIWGRYSTEQLEVRLGLQKIDFGSATMLRALRWFDQVDPRDPLRLTEGVWAGLVRYYFLNNANVWFWSLHGNKNLKGFEMIRSNTSIPELGGRVQFPVSRGEMAFSYHHRTADSRDMEGRLPVFRTIQENRVGFDAKWDLTVGLWLEAAWVNKDKKLGMFTNQEILTAGTDYTFGIGSGLNVVFEHLFMAFDEKAFSLSNTINFSAVSMRYPVGMFDTVSALFYYDWTEQSLYHFVNWYRQFDHTILYVIAYWNPESYRLPTAGFTENLYSGFGLQLMFVLNH